MNNSKLLHKDSDSFIKIDYPGETANSPIAMANMKDGSKDLFSKALKKNS